MTVNPRIVVGVDGSMSSTSAVRWAAETAARHNAPLLLLSAWTVPVAGHSGMGVPQSFFDDQVAEGRRRLAEATRIAHNTAPGEELSVTTELVAGPVALTPFRGHLVREDVRHGTHTSGVHPGVQRRS